MSRPRYTPARSWQALSDAEWAALAPFVLRSGPGRPMADPRGRMDAVFRAVTASGPWRGLPEEHGRADTVHRQFRRWAHAGLWTRLLRAVVHPGAPAALRALEHWICRAFRRALRLLGLLGLVLARRLGLLSALPAPPWLLPDPDLSAMAHALLFRSAHANGGLPERHIVRAVRSLLRMAGGRRRIPSCLAPA